MTVSLASQVAAVRAVVDVVPSGPRASAHQRLVAEHARAGVATLAWLARHEAFIRERCPELFRPSTRPSTGPSRGARP